MGISTALCSFQCPDSSLNLGSYKTLHQRTQKYLTSPRHSYQFLYTSQPTRKTCLWIFILSNFYPNLAFIEELKIRIQHGEISEPQPAGGLILENHHHTPFVTYILQKALSWVSYTTSLSWYGWFCILLQLHSSSFSGYSYQVSAGGKKRGKRLGESPPWCEQRWGRAALWTQSQRSDSQSLLPLPFLPIPKQPWIPCLHQRIRQVEVLSWGDITFLSLHAKTR